MSVAADADANVFVGGWFGGTLDVTDPPLDEEDGSEFLLKLSSSGEVLWAQQFEGVTFQSLAAGPDGSLTVVGFAGDASEVDLGGGPLAATPTNDAFIARYAADGAHVFSRVLAASIGNQRARAVDVTREGEAWVGFTFDGEIDLGLGLVLTQGGNDVAAVRYAP